MKRIFLFFLIALWGFTGFQSLSQTSLKYYDVLEQEAQGPVKYLIISDGFNYLYDRTGALKEITSEGKKIPFNVKRDALGRIEEITTFSLEQPNKRSRTKKKKYNEHNRISRSENWSDFLNENTIIDYYYDANGMCVRQDFTWDNDTENTRKFVYSDIKVDSHGNWISREASVLTDDGKIKPWKTEVRKITYWDDESANLTESDVDLPKVKIRDLIYSKCGIYPQQQTWEETKAIILKKKHLNPSDHDDYISFLAPFICHSYQPECLVMKNFTTTTYQFTFKTREEALTEYNTFKVMLKIQGIPLVYKKWNYGTADLQDRSVGLIFDEDDNIVSFMVLLKQSK